MSVPFGVQFEPIAQTTFGLVGEDADGDLTISGIAIITMGALGLFGEIWALDEDESTTWVDCDDEVTTWTDKADESTTWEDCA